MSRGQVLRVLVGVVAVTAVAAVVVAVRDEDGGGRVERLRSGSSQEVGGGDLTPGDPDPLVELTTTTMDVLGVTTSAPPPPPPPPATRRAPSPTAAPPTSSGPAPTTTVPPPPPAALDPGEPVCSAPPEGGLIRGDVVAVVMADGVHELSLDGTRDVLLAGTPRPEGGLFASMVWSANGRRLAYISPSPTRQNVYRYAQQDLTVVDLESGCRRLLTRSGSDSFVWPSWSPDGERLSYNRRLDGPCCTVSLETARPDGTDVRRVVSDTGYGGQMGGTFAPDGSGRIAFSQGGKMSVVDPAGKVTTLDTNPSGAEIESWSPDATRVVYTLSVNQGVWVAQADGTGVRRLAPTTGGGPTQIWTSRFAPDAKRVVFNWRSELWVTDADGNNQRRLVEKASQNGGWWTPDGKAVVYSGEGGTFVLPVDGTEATPRLLTATGSVLSVFRRP